MEGREGRREGGREGKAHTYVHSNIDRLGDNLGIGIRALAQLLPSLVKRRGRQGPRGTQRNSRGVLISPLGELRVGCLGEGVDAVETEHDIALGGGGEVADADGELVGEAAFPVLGQNDLEAAVADLQGGLASEGVDAWKRRDK